MAETTRFLVTEVHNFGGFFGGHTVSLSGHALAEGAEEETLTIDEAALVNISDRHHVTAGMLLTLEMAGDRVEQSLQIFALGSLEDTALRFDNRFDSMATQRIGHEVGLVVLADENRDRVGGVSRRNDRGDRVRGALGKQPFGVALVRAIGE